MSLNFQVKTLTKSRKKIRMAIFGPTGCGKTYTSLAIMRGLVDGKILIIDTERKTAGLYAEELNYDGRVDVIDDLPNFSPETYTAVFEYAAMQGYEGIIADSFSHAWEGALDEVDKASQRSKSGNSFAAWKEVTPMHNKMVDTILKYPGHVICTMRVKTEWVMEDVNGKKVPRKVGLQPRQKDGIEYEFDFTASMDQENNFVIDKTRAKAFTGYVEKRPGADLAAKLRDWAEAGGEPDENLSDPHLALKSFNVDQADVQRMRETTQAKGHKFSDIVLEAWNGGKRGKAGLQSHIDELPDKTAKPTEEPKPPQTPVETVTEPNGQQTMVVEETKPTETGTVVAASEAPKIDPLDHAARYWAIHESLNLPKAGHPANTESWRIMLEDPEVTDPNAEQFDKLCFILGMTQESGDELPKPWVTYLKLTGKDGAEPAKSGGRKK